MSISYGLKKMSEKQLIALRKNAKLGGRPKGVLSGITMKRIQTEQAMREIIYQHTGKIVGDLLNQSDIGKTEASKELLGRAYGGIVQKNINENINMSLKDLAEMRQKQRETEALQVNASELNAST